MVWMKATEKAIRQYKERREECSKKFAESRSRKQEARKALTTSPVEAYQKTKDQTDAPKPFAVFAAEHVPPGKDESRSISDEQIQQELRQSSQEKPDIVDDLMAMLHLSSLVYSFATVRQIIKEGGVSNSWFPWSKEQIQLENSVILLAHEPDVMDDTKRKAGSVLQIPITVTNLLKFFTPNNIAFLSNDTELASDANTDAIDSLKPLGDDAFLWEFDDAFANKHLVYGITVNRVDKRVSIVFRGSVVSRDWQQNLQIGLKEMKTPAVLEGEVEAFRVHAGFKNYLLDDSIEQDPSKYNPSEPSKYGQIVQNLNGIFAHEENGVKVHEGFSIWVTGHSLGGALSTLLVFRLAGSERLAKLNAHPTVTCVSYASPYVGDDNFSKAFTALEAKGRLRHLRVTNQGDLVPVGPWGGYVHTGINLHLLDDEGNFELTYNGFKSWKSQLSLWSAQLHSILNYWVRGMAANEQYTTKLANKELLNEGQIASLYKNPAIVGDLAK